MYKIAFADWPYNPLEYIFGVDILYLAGLAIILLALIKSFPKYQVYFTGAFLAMVIILSQTVNTALTLPERNYVIPFIGGSYSWSYFPLFPWLAYPLAGYLFYLIEDKISKVLIENKAMVRFGIAALFLVVIIFGKFGFSVTIDLPKYYHHGFKFSLWAFALIIFWATILSGITNQKTMSKAEQLLAWMGKNITLIYVIQWLIIGNVATAIYQTQPLKMFWIWFGGILAVSLILARLIQKMNIKF